MSEFLRKYWDLEGRIFLRGLLVIVYTLIVLRFGCFTLYTWNQELNAKMELLEHSQKSSLSIDRDLASLQQQNAVLDEWQKRLAELKAPAGFRVETLQQDLQGQGIEIRNFQLSTDGAKQSALLVLAMSPIQVVQTFLDWKRQRPWLSVESFRLEKEGEKILLRDLRITWESR